MLELPRKITNVRVVKDVTPLPTPGPAERPAIIAGITVKIKPPVTEHALYVTLNDINGVLHEIFVSTKDASLHEHFAGLTRMISAMWRRVPNPPFVVEELLAVQSVNGYYYGGTFYTSITAHIGHLISNRMLELKAIEAPVSINAPEICINCE